MIKKISLIHFLFTFCFFSCNKNKPSNSIDPHNRSLENIDLNELKTMLSGTWLLKRDRNCGFAGCTTTIFPSGQEDIFYFLPQDSVRRIKANGTILVSDKAAISKSQPDNLWFYGMNGGLTSWAFMSIKNDTLIAVIDGGGGSESYLIKKP